MKNITLALLLWIALLATALSYGQFRLNKTESFNFGITLDPYASYAEKGLCFGAEIEYTGAVYTRLGITAFPKLTDGYTDVIGGIGAVFTSGYFDNTTYYAGVRLGVIIRRQANASAGVECGINHKLSESILIGIRGTYDYRSDFEFYGEQGAMQYSTFIKIGFIL